MLAWWACVAAPADARQPAEGAGKAGIDSDPIACWWRTDRSAVHVGEHFTLTLTCGVSETANLRIVTDLDRLDPAALDLTPFEIVGGTRHGDIQAPSRRYFQYSYTLRLLGDGLFGQDVDIPSIPITYNIENVRRDRHPRPGSGVPASAVARAHAVARAAQRDRHSGRLPGHVRRHRSPRVSGDGELAAAGLLFIFAAALAGLALVRIARPRVARVAAERGLRSPAEMLRGCMREAVRLKSVATRTGWTSDLIGESLTVLRIAGAVALGRLVAQRVVDGSVAAQDGQLTIRKAF